MTLITLLLLAWGGAFLGWRLARLPGPLRYLPCLLPLGFFLVFFGYTGAIERGEVVQHSLAWAPTLGVDLALRLDGFSLLFALLITGIGTLVTIYATAYFSDATPKDRSRFLFLILAFMAAMLGTVLSDNLIAMFVFWEATSLLSFLLIGFEAQKLQARKAALQSLIITGGGGSRSLAGCCSSGWPPVPSRTPTWWPRPTPGSRAPGRRPPSF